MLSPGDQATLRTEAAAFIIRWYQLTNVVSHPGGVRDHSEPKPTNRDEIFDPRKAILRILERSEVEYNYYNPTTKYTPFCLFVDFKTS